MIWVRKRRTSTVRKNIKMLKFLILILFTGLTTTGYPAFRVKSDPGKPAVVKIGAAANKHIIKNDSSKVALRNFDQQKIKRYRDQAAFQYDDDVPAESLWDKFWKWFWNIINSLLKDGTSGGFIKYTVMVALAALIIFVLVKTAGLDLRVVFGRSKPAQIPFYESHDNIHEIDFHEEIQQAINSGNYRLAVRLCYLSSLKKLSDQSLINWQPEKTNQTYISEIEDVSVKKQFSVLTRQFEYIWYGEFFIDERSFAGIKNNFDQFNPLKR